MKALFRHNLKSYALMTALGLLAGFSVVLFIELPDNSFLSFYYWSSSTFGFLGVFDFVDCFIQRDQKMCGNQCRNIHIFNVPYYDRTSIFSALSQRSNAVSVIIRTYAKSYRGLAVIQRSARVGLRCLGNHLMVRQKKYDMGEAALCNAGGIFVCGDGHPFL